VKVPSQRQRRAWRAALPGDELDIVSMLVAAVLIVLVGLDRSGAPRTLLAFAFMLFVPGRALVSNWPWLARWSAAAMSMILSLSVLSVLAAVTLWAGHWQPTRLFQAEAIASIIGLAFGMIRRHLRPIDRRPIPRRQAAALALLVGMASGGDGRHRRPDSGRRTRPSAR